MAAWHVPYWPAAAGRVSGLYRPLTQFAYAVLWNVGGGTPTVFHIYAVVLHVLAALGVAWLLARAVPRPCAVIGALLFAVHPVHVEAVANIVGSAEVLAALGALGYIAVLLRADGGTAPGEALSWRSAVVAALCYALAMGAKESAATLPVIALAALWGWRRPHPGSEADAPRAWTVIVRGWRVWVASLAALAGMVLARYAVLGALVPTGSALAAGISGVGAGARVWTMLAAWPLVIQLLVWPTRLMPYYGPDIIAPHTGATPAAVAAVAMSMLLAAGAGWLARRTGDRRPAVALVWVAMGYLVASNLVVPTGQLLAERTLYMSTIGVAALAAWAMAVIAPAERPKAGARRDRPVLAVGIGVVLLGAVASTRAVGVWASEPRLFEHAIAIDPHAAYLYQQLARAYGRGGEEARAMAALGEANRLDPDDEPLAVEYFDHLVKHQAFAQALAVVRVAGRAHPTSQPLRLDYLSALLAAAGADSAIAEIRAHGPTDPAGGLRFIILAHAFERKHLGDSALAAYQAASEAVPSNGPLHFLLAEALHGARRDREARAQIARAASLGGVPPAALRTLRASVDSSASGQ